MRSACPSPLVLEQLALGDAGTPECRAHVAGCGTCRALIDDIRENQRFLQRAGAALVEAIDAPAPPREPTPAIADTVHGYELHEEIARGGQGVVYRAVQRSTHRPAAVKVLLTGAHTTARQQRRFEREIEIAANLRHRNLVTVLESGETSAGRPFVAMEFVNGVSIDESVRERLGDSTPGDRARVHAIVRLMRDVAAGVGHAHAAGVIHRDIKPSNILVEPDGTPRVLDFGLARPTVSSAQATVTQEFAGTPAYASPEQLDGDALQIDTRTDVYALGLVLYRLLTGRHPYPCDGSFVQVAAHACHTESVPPSRYLPRLSTDVETIVLKCLAKEPQRRYLNAAALASDLDDYLEGRPISARRDSTAYVLRKLALRHRTATLAGSLVVVTVIGAALGLAMLARDLDVTRRAAEERLAASEVLRARLMAGDGDADRAEALLWRQLSQFGMGTGARDPVATEPVTTRRLRWALMELYSELPCVLRAKCEHPQMQIGFGPGGSVWAIDARGSRRDWAVDGPLLRETRPLTTDINERVGCVDPGAQFALMLSDGSLRIADFNSGRTVSGPVAVRHSTYNACVADDGSFVAIVDRADPDIGDVTIFDRATLGVVGHFTDFAQTIKFTRGPGGALQLLVGSLGGDTRLVGIRQAPDWRIVRTIDLPPNVQGDPNGVRAMCPAGGATPLFATVSAKIFAAVPISAKPARLVAEVRSSVTAMSIADKGRSLAAGQEDGTVHILRFDDYSVASTFAGDGTVISLAVDDAGDRLAVGSLTGNIRVFETTDRAWLERIPTTPCTHAGMAVASDGTIAWGDDLGGLHLRPAAPPHRVVTVPAHTGVITSVAFSPDGSEIMTAGWDGAIRCWRRDATLSRTIAAGGPKVWCARYGPEGRLIVASDQSGHVRLWRDREPAPYLILATGFRVPKVALSPDGRSVVATADLKGAFVWDTASGALLHTLGAHHEVARAVAYSPDGRLIATGADDRTVCIWDAETGALLRKVAGLPWGPFDLVFHPQEGVLLAAGRGGELVVLDPDGGEEVATLNVHSRHIFSVAVSADGSKIVTAGEDPWIGITDISHLARYIRGNEAYWRDRLATDPDASR